MRRPKFYSPTGSSWAPKGFCGGKTYTRGIACGREADDRRSHPTATARGRKVACPPLPDRAGPRSGASGVWALG